MRNFTLSYDGLGVTNDAIVPDPYPGIDGALVIHSGRSWAGSPFEDVYFVDGLGASNRYGNLTNLAVGPRGTPMEEIPRAVGAFGIAPTNSGTFVRLLSYDIASLDDNDMDEVVPWMVVHNPSFATYWLKTGTTVAGDVDNTRHTHIEINNAGLPVQGQTNETVTLYVESNQGRVAVDNVRFQIIGPIDAVEDAYSVADGGTLNVAAPGVLGNDTLLAGAGPLAVSLLAATTNGTLTLATNGGFSYIPTNAPGMHGFLYEVTDEAGNTNQSAALVSVLPLNGLFHDDFERPPGFVGAAPWKTAGGGTWLAANGIMQSTSQFESASHLYISNSWTDYSVEVRASMPTNAYSWNVGGRLNPATATYYGVALLPYGPGIFYHPTNSWVLRLVKFTGWDAWSGANLNNLADVPVGGPDTNQHTLKLSFSANRIMVDWDGERKIDTVDNSWESAPYTNGGVTIGMYTGSNSYAVNFDEVAVTALTAISATNVDVQLPEDTATNLLLNVSSPSGPVAFEILSAPAHGLLSQFNPGTGYVNYTPDTNYFGTDSFTYRVSDGSQSATGSVNLTITAVEDPALADNQFLSVARDTVTNLVLTATDADGAEIVTERLVATATASPDDWAAVDAASKIDAVVTDNDGYINSSGTTGTRQQFALSDPKFIQPADSITEVTLRATCQRGASGGSSFRVTTVVGGDVENASSQSVGNSYADYFDTFNGRPGGGAWSLADVQELQIRIENVSRTINCTRLDAHVSFLGSTNRSYTILSGPAHGGITGLNTNNGLLTYTPAAGYVGADSFTFRVNAGGILSTGLISITVVGTNSGPVVANPISNQPATYGTAFSFTFPASTFFDPDSPALTYSATGLPPGIQFTNATRTFSGIPTTAGNFPVSLVAADDSLPSLTATNVFDLNVARATLSITASNQAKPYGVPFVFAGNEFSAAGLKLADTATAATLGSDAAPANVAAGAYPITITNATGSGLGNYDLSYFNGTMTVTPSAPYAITEITVTNGVAALTWQSISGRVYRLEYKDDLLLPVWTEVPVDILSTGSSTTTTNDTGGATNRFYRVK